MFSEKIIATTPSAFDEANKDNIDEKIHTLEGYSFDFFLSPPKQTLLQSLFRGAFKKKDSYQPWAFTRVSYWSYNLCYKASQQDPIKQPLLKKTANQSEEIQQRACQSFLDILFSKILHIVF